MRLLAGKSPKYAQEGRDFVVRSRFGTRRATMPDGWLLEAVHPSVLKAVEWILFCNIPAYDGYVVSQDELLKLEPRVPQGRTNLLAYSGGADSTAALLLLKGSDFRPVYLRRSYETYELMAKVTRFGIRWNRRKPVQLCATDYVDQVIQHHGAMVIDNDLELLSVDAGIGHGFRYGYGYGAIIALLADFLGAGAVSFGSVLETVWMGGGGMNPVHDSDNVYVDITEDPKSAYNLAKTVFAIAGLQFCQPVAACSEVVTTRLTRDTMHVSCPFGYGDGVPCGNCFKCFRKEQLLGRPASHPLHRRVVHELSQPHLAMAASVIEGCHTVGSFPQEVVRYRETDTSWTNRYYDESLTRLCTDEVATHVSQKLAEHDVEPMTPYDVSAMKSFLRPVDGVQRSCGL